MTQKEFDDFVEEYSKICSVNDLIPTELYTKYDVKKGLRDSNGKGVLTGLTNISRVDGFANVDGVRTPIEGCLWYRGYDVYKLVDGLKKNRFGFEEAAFLLLFGNLPTEEQLAEFRDDLSLKRALPVTFIRDVILKAHSRDIMNSMTKSVLTLAAYDPQMSDCSIKNVLRQCMELISVFPMLAVYGYHAYSYYDCNNSLIIHRPDPNLSVSENILRLLRPDGQFTELEAKVTGKPHMNLMGSRPAEPQAPQRMPEPEPEPEDFYESRRAEEYDNFEDPYEEPAAGEETVMAPTANDAVDYFNSLPESVRKMILNSDE
jgi:citrate synthase